MTSVGVVDFHNTEAASRTLQNLWRNKLVQRKTNLSLKVFLMGYSRLQAAHRHDRLYDAVHHPGEGVEGCYEHVEQRERGEDNGGSQCVAQKHEQGKGEQGHQDGRGCPEVHAHGIQVFPGCQRLQLPMPCPIDLQGKSAMDYDGED